SLSAEAHRVLEPGIIAGVSEARHALSITIEFSILEIRAQLAVESDSSIVAERLVGTIGLDEGEHLVYRRPLGVRIVKTHHTAHPQHPIAVEEVDQAEVETMISVDEDEIELQSFLGERRKRPRRITGN